MTDEKKDEKVMCIETCAFEDLGYFEGYTNLVDKYLPQIMNSLKTHWIPRSECETDPAFKQLIPYCLFRAKLPTRSDPFYLRYRRTKKSGEARLVGECSLGIGGHISLDDTMQRLGDDLADTLHNEEMQAVQKRSILQNMHKPLVLDSAYYFGIQRELDEELRIDVSCTGFNTVGLVNDDSNDVGKVHLGVVHIVELALPSAHPNDKASSSMYFDTKYGIREDKSMFEKWSQILIEAGVLQ